MTSGQFLSLLAFLFISAGPIYGQPASLHGRVTDESDKPVPFARVVGIFPDDTTVAIRADERGEFHLELGTVLPIRLRAFAPGYAPVIKDLTAPIEGVILLRLAASRLADSV